MNIILEEKIYKKPEKKVKLDWILSCFRKAIKDDIIEFKKSKRTKMPGNKRYIWFSDFSGKIIESKKLVECDHEHPKTFRQLAYDFIKNFNIDIDTIKTHPNLGIAYPLKGDWIKYHRDNCKLRIVSATENKDLWLLHRRDDIKWEHFYNTNSQ